MSMFMLHEYEYKYVHGQDRDMDTTPDTDSNSGMEIDTNTERTWTWTRIRTPGVDKHEQKVALPTTATKHQNFSLINFYLIPLKLPEFLVRFFRNPEKVKTPKKFRLLDISKIHFALSTKSVQHHPPSANDSDSSFWKNFFKLLFWFRIF